jgi:hypothetical protein
MDKSHIACLLAGAACASAYFWLKSNDKPKDTPPSLQQDFESADYLNIKNEQLARVIKYFG